MKCTRCNGKINFDYYWHLPICKECRIKMLNSKDLILTNKELIISEKRFEKENSK
jgi:hypothetical protein